ncbi:prostatic acid phosphatase-like [Planococcus citri]|uniref:prostatic acid phosphatase-like n=1 Tax=Planococcus citri TaxID=170843 RepID=UPI0031F8BF47
MKLIILYLIGIVASGRCIDIGDFDKYTEDELKDIYGEVVHASVLFRHGDRTPYAPYPLDPYKNYVWSQGYGHLTNIGKERLYRVGKWFRKRYEHLVREKYTYEDVLMQSSDYDRTLMSAAAFLAGFYPPSNSELWNSDNITWQPIPIHSIPLEYDSMISMYRPCDAYNQEALTANYAIKYKEMFKKYEIFFNFVGVNTGIIFSEHYLGFAFLKLMEVYDSLAVQSQHNLTLPDWAEEVFPQPMEYLALRIFDFGTYSLKMKRIKAGPFLKSIKADMNKKAQDNLEQKIHFYSGHDATITTVMNTLEISNDILPPYGSALMFELRKKHTEYFVTILYRNSTEYPPFLLQLKNCNTFCTLQEFINVINTFIPEDWEKECKIEVGYTSSYFSSWPFDWVQTLMLFFVILFLVSTILYFHYERNPQIYMNMFGKTKNKEM